jgi:hypothetical protein
MAGLWQQDVSEEPVRRPFAPPSRNSKVNFNNAFAAKPHRNASPGHWRQDQWQGAEQVHGVPRGQTK